MEEVKNILIQKFNKIREELRPEYKFRKSEKYMEQPLYADTFSAMLYDADKNTIITAIDGIAKGKFATTSEQRAVDGFVLKDIILDNIHDEEIVLKSFNAMKTILNMARKSLNNQKETISNINSMQNIPYAIGDLYDHYPSLVKQTDEVYAVYDKMMKEYSLSNSFNTDYHYAEVEDYYHGRDDYKLSKEAAVIRRQEDTAWETKELIDAAKQRIYNKFTKKEISEYEQFHAKQTKTEDAQYISELKDFIREHKNRELSKEHQKQIDEIKLKHNDKSLNAAYENYKDVARTQSNAEKSQTATSGKVPEKTVFLGRAEYKR